MGHRLFHLSLMSVLLLSSVQIAQPWQTFSGESGQQHQQEIVPVTRPSDVQAASLVTVQLDEAVPDQGRPQGRLRGGGSR